jgi:CcmD family protein
MLKMGYTITAFTVAWLIYFAYLFYLHRRLGNIRRRLDAREK